ncbi:MAG: hypothetical protein KGK07_11765 [Chloroflexota bacterium]|nr:hypothetical protein [Chloroflexota bacterium]
MVNDIMLSAMAWATSLRTIAVQRLKEERGQDLIEYAVLGGAIALVAMVALLASPFSGAVTNFVSTVGACVQFQTNNCKGR